MLWLILVVLGLGLLFGPFLWVRWIMSRYRKQRPDLPGTGGELADHLIKKYHLKAQLTPGLLPDHFNPETNTVQLEDSNFKGQHLTAVAIAAHEVGHAIQYAMKDKRLLARHSLAKLAINLERIAQVCLMLLPVLSVVPPTMGLARILILPIIFSVGFSSLIHLLTLPVEFDASFKKALPMLQEGEYVSAKDLRSIKTILLAAALTYVSSAAIRLLNFRNLWRLMVR